MLADTGEHLHAILQGLHGRMELGALGKVREPLPLPIQDTVGLRTPPEIVVVNDSNPEILVGSPGKLVEKEMVVAAKEHPIANVPRCSAVAHWDNVGGLQTKKSTPHTIPNFA